MKFDSKNVRAVRNLKTLMERVFGYKITIAVAVFCIFLFSISIRAEDLMPIFYNNGNFGIGTENPLYTLSVNGTILAKEIIVNNKSQFWADFVFEPGYKLRPLDELEAYIKKNKHLPDLPSNSAIQADGVSIGDIQGRLLQKIEELTLYVIQLKKMVTEQIALRE
ncbi:hypothetical protein ACFL96_00355 [Thermoproteota archaeon]